MSEQVNKKRILIGITTAETVSHETMESIYNLVIPENVETVLRIIHAYNVADGRNDLVNIMFQENCDYIFFLIQNPLFDLPCIDIEYDFVVGHNIYHNQEHRQHTLQEYMFFR